MAEIINVKSTNDPIYGVDVRIDPCYFLSTDTFTSTPTGPSIPITLTFNRIVNFFSITTLDVKNMGGVIEIYNTSGGKSTSISVPRGRSTINWPPVPRGTNLSVDISKIVLIPAPNDTVAYQNLYVEPLVARENAVTTPATQPPAKPARSVRNGTIKIKIRPVGTPAQTLKLEFPFTFDLIPIGINLSDPLIYTAIQFISQSLLTYVDEERTLKTLLNYGEDRQTVILNYRYGNIDLTTGLRKLQLKLLEPIPQEINLNSNVFISREIVKSLIDKMRVRFAPALDPTPYLRPLNNNIKVNVDTGKFLKNITLNNLKLTSGSAGIQDSSKNVDFADALFRQWYSYDFNSSELNIDFSDYANFVFYSSAAMRLSAFRQKLKNIETLEAKQYQFIGTTFTGSTAYATTAFIQEESAKLSKQKEDIIRGFDRYEQYLYFTDSGSIKPYSASAYFADEGYEYNSIGYWPKQASGALYPVSSSTAETWYNTQLAIAQRYDDFNENNLVNTIPTHIREDDNSAAYITFVTMVGHFFDTIKPYVDQFPYVFDRDLDPNLKLSKDLVNDVAAAFGFEMPSANSIYDLADTILGTDTDSPRRDYTIETYKRLLHNLPFFAKAKGTRSALNALLRSLGISPQLLTVRESGIANTGSYNTFDEYTTGIYCTSSLNTFITLPLSASLRAPTSIQLNFKTNKQQSMTLLTGDEKWGLHLVRHPELDVLGKLVLTSGSSNTYILTSSFFDLYSDKLTNVSIRNYANYTDLAVYQVENEDVLYQISVDSIGATRQIYNTWNSTNYLYVGGSGSRSIGNFEGVLDEIRLWKINLSDEMTLNTAFDPGSNAGDVYTDATNHLIAQLSFNTYDTGSQNLTTFPNESPYKDKTVSPAMTTFAATNVSQSQMIRYSRTVRQAYPEIGGPAYVTNKVKVGKAPVFDINSVNSKGVKQLSRTRSIVKVEDKPIQRGKNKVNISTSPTEIINQNIIRNLGIENINVSLGIPNEAYDLFAKTLTVIKNHYNQYYYATVNINRYIRIMSDANSILDQVLEYFIPSKASPLNGIVIEPNLLDRVKIPPYKQVRFYGKNSRKTTDAPSALTGSRSDYGATFAVSKTIQTIDSTLNGRYSVYDLQSEDWYTEKLISQSRAVRKRVSIHPNKDTIGSYLRYDQNHEDWLTTRLISQSIKKSSPTTIEVASTRADFISSAYITYNIQHEDWITTRLIIDSGSSKKPASIDSGLGELNKFKFNSTNNGRQGAEPYGRIYPRKLFNYEISETRTGGITSLNPKGIYDIRPYVDFSDIGTYTFFNSPSGIYYYRTTTKQPVYNNPINFSLATTWSYGTGYTINDVVYQNITSEQIILGNLTSSAQIGNDKYYVFKTRPSYTSSVDGTYFYLNSVPSYIPPSLDKDNWEPLRFISEQGPLPKRIVFDTFTVPDPSLNNFKVTTISIDKIVDIPTRYLDLFTIPTVLGNSYVSGELPIQNIAALFALQANVANIRIRLYRTQTARDSDIGRSLLTLPTGSHGVLLDTVVPIANTRTLINPIATLIAGNTPPLGKLYYTVDNLNSTSTGTISLLLYYYAIQVEPRVPLGYLRKHYKFYRDNSTATRRRNYAGCTNTSATTIDGLPPVQIFISEGSDISVVATQLNNELITGGGGTLNAT